MKEKINIKRNGESIFDDSNSIKRVEFVYRIDFRSPDQIFATGFSPWGNNDYLLYHLSGQSVTAPNAPVYMRRTSNFVGTTDLDSYDPTTLDNRLSTTIYGLTGGVQRATGADDIQRVWVYRIQTNSNFYDAVNTVHSVIDNYCPRSDTYRILEDFLTYFSHHYEFSVRGSIPSNSIQRAEEWVRITDPNRPGGVEWVRGNESHINPNFVRVEGSLSNPNPYPRIVDGSLRQVARRVYGVLTHITTPDFNFPNRNPDIVVPSTFCFGGCRGGTSFYSDEDFKDPAMIVDVANIPYMMNEIIF